MVKLRKNIGDFLELECVDVLLFYSGAFARIIIVFRFEQVRELPLLENRLFFSVPSRPHLQNAFLEVNSLRYLLHRTVECVSIPLEKGQLELVSGPEVFYI